MATNPITSVKSVHQVIDEKSEMLEQISEYGLIIFDSLYLIVIGMMIIFIIHKSVIKFLYPYVDNKRLISVVFSAIYVLIIDISTLLVLKEIGFDVKVIGPISIVTILIGAVIIFFLVPFLPRLPLKIGHMVETNGVLGIVHAITTFHTIIQKSDGCMAFIPNALVMTSKIVNYHDSPYRRIEIKLNVRPDSNINEMINKITETVDSDKRVLDKPSKAQVFIMEADAVSVQIVVYCWVINEDWSDTRSDLWMNLMIIFNNAECITLSRPQQEVILINE